MADSLARTRRRPQVIRAMMHGLVVASEVTLPDCRPAPRGPADVEYRFGAPRTVPDGVVPGRTLARLPHSDGPGAFFTLTERADGGRLLRVHGTCDVAISEDLDAATFHMDPVAEPGLASVLASGLVVSVLLTLRGHLVLHASAVEHHGAAVGIVGRSGMGKSTVSTLLCRAGGRLVTDDVLRVDIADGSVFCRLGSAETRLRPAARELASEGRAVRQTADGRSAVALPIAQNDPLPLSCLVVPSPDRMAAEVQVERRGQVDALMLLASFPRIVGWEDPRTRAQQFDAAGELVSRIPVFVARLPWGPPFPPTLGATLLDALRL